MNFVKTPDGQKRKACFGQLDACSVDDVIIIAECGAETAKQWRSEKDRHDYLAQSKNSPGLQCFPTIRKQPQRMNCQGRRY